VSSPADRLKRLEAALYRAAEVHNPKDPSAEKIARLLKAFGSPGVAFASGADSMKNAAGLSTSLAYSFSLIPAVARFVLRERASAVRFIRTIDDVRVHLRPIFLSMPYECGYILCLRENGRLIGVHQLRKGSIDEAPFYTRVIMETALRSGGDYFILAHNHPSGTIKPSESDCTSTLTVLDALGRIGLNLIDHLVMADDQIASIRKMDIIPKSVWEEIAPMPEIFKGWLR